jgi:hypothetical protein
MKLPSSEDRKRKQNQPQEDEAPVPSATTPPQKRQRTSPQGPHIEGAIGANTAVSVSGKEINLFESRRKEVDRHRNFSSSPRPEAVEHTPSKDERAPKRQRGSPEGHRVEDSFRTEDTGGIENSHVDPINYWIKGKHWPKEYFEQESTMNPLLKRKISSSSLSKKSETSDGSAREGKNPAAKSRLYEKTLAAANIYMGGGPGITDACRALCKSLLETEQPLPLDSLFRDDRFEKTCERLRNENEAKVVRDISPLLVPSVEVLCACGEEHLEYMVDHVNQKWYGCVPIIAGPVPQPDYSAGCKETIFTKGQLRKLEPFISGWKSTPFLATAWMYFLYLTMEVKCGNEELNIADRQNAHSSSVAVKQVVDLYRMVSREHELDRKILSFSVSHDQEAVRIYGYYPVIDGEQTSVYRHTIRKLDITNEDGKDKWTTYVFTRNVYDVFGPIHFERLRSAVDQLPDLSP